jgi:hypothetical protein
MAGVNIRTIAELMGHRKIQMTMRYSHLSPAHNEVAVDLLPRYTSPVRVSVEGSDRKHELTPLQTPAKPDSL